LSQALSGRDDALAKLNRQIAELGDMLAMERSNAAELKTQLSQIAGELTRSTSERDDLKRKLTVVIGERDSLKAELGDAQAKIAASDAKQKELEEAYKAIDADKEKITALLSDIAALESLRDDLQSKLGASEANAQKITSESQAQVEILNRQILALRDQLAQIAAALDVSEAKAKEQDIQIADLGTRLNAALASKVEELARYRSEFFGRLREVLGQRSDIQVVGDRFVFQSEVLFDSGSAVIGPAGQDQLDILATTLILISKEIPNDINWVLRIDGHTDKRPIYTAQFPSNWELSTARAVAVAKFLISRGIPPERLATAGFAEFAPLDPSDSEEAYKKNRRIEMKLDQR
jgi:chemotaxis protein MotB